MRCFAAKTTLFAALILIVCLPCLGASLKVTINAPPYTIEKSASGDLIKIEDFGGTSTPGHPMLPAKTYCIAIPPNAVVTDVRLSFPKEVELDDLYEIPAAGIPLTSAMTEEQINRLLDLKAQNYADTYYKDDPYPQSAASYAGEAKYRRYRYVRVRYWPFTYLPASRRLVHRPQLDVEIEYDLRDLTDADAISLYDTIGDVEARSFLVNYWDALRWYDQARDSVSPPDGRGVPAGGYSYVIICPPKDALHLYDPLPEVAPGSDFVVHKESLGHTVKAVTTKWIYDHYSNTYEYDYDGQGPKLDEPMAIKQFLAHNAPGWGIRNVLLVGQNWGFEVYSQPFERPYYWWPDGATDILLNAVPLRVCSPEHWLGSMGLPSDAYFADLGTNWDLDLDKRWCEWAPVGAGGDLGEGGPEFAPDLYVARIPFAKVNDPMMPGTTILQRVLNKLKAVEPIEDEEPDRAWRSKALYLGAFMHWSTYEFHWPVAYGKTDADLDWYIEHYTPQGQGWTNMRLYEADDIYYSYDYDYDHRLDDQTTEHHWGGAGGAYYGIVNAGGHGCLEGQLDDKPYWQRDYTDAEGEQNKVYAGVETSDELDDSHPSFVISGSCLTAFPTAPPDPPAPVWWSNMARALIRNGTAGIVGSMSYTIYWDDPLWRDPIQDWTTPSLNAYFMGFLVTDNGSSIGAGLGRGLREYHDRWHGDADWGLWLQQYLMCCSCVTGEPALRREGVQQVTSPDWLREGWYVFTLPINPCEPGQSRMLGPGAIPQLQIFDPAWGIWLPYSGDLDTDHAYKIWGRPDLTYWGCHATVDQIIDLSPAGTHWIGTARNHPTNTEHWRIKCVGDPVKLDQAAANGWIGDTMAVFNNDTGQEETFGVGEWRDVGEWQGGRIDVLPTLAPVKLMVPRGG